MYRTQTRIAQIFALPQAGTIVTVMGWVRTKRDQKTFSFIELNDGSCLANLQVVAEQTLPDYVLCVQPLTTGSAIAVTGTVCDSPGKGQRYEIRASSINVFNLAPSDFPLQKKHHTFEYLREIAHLRPRTNTMGAIARLRSAASFYIHSFFNERGFIYVHTPIITASDCEGAGEMFSVTTLDLNNVPKAPDGTTDFSKDFFGKHASLTVSGQLEGEIYALALGNVYTFGPTFRAENSNTARHLAEFWMVEPEMAFATLTDDMDMAEQFVRSVIRQTLEKNHADLELFDQRIDKTVLSTLRLIADNDFERIEYKQAIDLLLKSSHPFEYPVKYGMDIQSEHERHLTEVIIKKPVIVYNYPREIKAFYMKQNDDNLTVRAMDVLVPRIGELIGGSEREDSLSRLEQRLDEMKLSRENYWWYLELRKYGGVPHAGFGLGFERLMLLLTGMHNIRDVIPFPRYPGSAAF